MKPYKRAVATINYVQRGEQKKRYQGVGTLFQRDDGSLTLKLEALPLGEGWNGFLNFYDIDEKRQDGGGNQGSQTKTISQEDDIPF